MKVRSYVYILCVLFFSACEEIIEVNLNDADPRVVIEANLSDLQSTQRIRVSKTVAFDEPVNSVGVTNAVVLVVDSRGGYHNFQHENDGNYVARDFTPESGGNYSLYVEVDGESFHSSCYMPVYVDVDSTGIVQENILGDSYYFATFKFNDPPKMPNYYKYDIAINNENFGFSSVFQDKFNDGLYVTHQVSDLDAELQPGDYIAVRRYCVDEKVFNYWNEYQGTNPGSAAPANPTSNISNNALGYFSVASAEEFRLQVVDMDVDWDNLEDNPMP
ncbi:DUF4249 domain-containing protein [Sphingobacterium sp. SGR-19]|uniref:DUF4249 domain-containing protein n=1 Tax=Sphingobacterium sp. SGR-19 TaxID=2710886 RepID=UPI0013EB0D05|nr:DUF4249 domain-containing protein [Sphingobacterium sp. SGR-19]NGM65356.1 DUF4249 domain-containing protein [Sphingobacterium sp. SGR-19]